MVLNLPIEIVSEILNNLPTKSLCKYLVLSHNINHEIKKIIIKRFNKVFLNSGKRLLVSNIYLLSDYQKF